MKPGPKPVDRLNRITGTIVCIKCKRQKIRREFYKDRARHSGLYPECKICVLERRRVAYAKSGITKKDASRAYSRRLRLKVLTHYGHKCACCGESRYEFLAVDHEHGGGLKHRREVVRGRFKSMNYWLIKHNFPPGFRLLCHNCNCARGWYGKCPHETEREQQQSAA